ncbi:hypothetical protein H3H36_15975 [Duganella sp. FT3S]|uniref:Uncharacterized protein n=1 Tax=Rugamonas fusca TaxID=2758568 RepID=A0A7W2EJ91_9BURK|nr:hypothetical protein [Rugamonas fusca]MBA5606854.1 hypothetical protein [Rugamonas fusca]
MNQPGTHTPDMDDTKRLRPRRGLIPPACRVYGNVVRVLFPLTIGDALSDEAPGILEPAMRAAPH